MALHKHLRVSVARWGAVAVLGVAALGVGALVAQAYQHATPVPHSGQAAPVPTFTLGVQTPTPTPTPTPVIDRAAERFLTVGTGIGANVWWRGVAGACGGPPPVVERSTDGGATWTNVTPPDAAQLASIEAFDQTEADLVVGVGANCEPQALRTFTQGQFWESNPDVLAASSFVALADPATVATPAWPVAAPCAQAHSLRTGGDLAALVCDGTAYVADAGGTWVALPAPEAATVAIEADTVLVAHADDACAGLALTRYAVGGQSQLAPPACTDLEAATAPSAIAAAESGPYVWSADTVTAVGR